VSDEELGFPVDVVTGVSLPMVLEALVVRSNMELADVVDVCLEVAGESVRKLSDILG
jgi:mannose/fructose-specific phosphotransferase system component IIA